MPRPLSMTEIELSVWIVTTMSSQRPASASSIELSTTSKTRWCKPVPSEVSPMYMPGRLRTASRPSSIWIDPSPYPVSWGKESGLCDSLMSSCKEGPAGPGRQSDWNPPLGGGAGGCQAHREANLAAPPGRLDSHRHHHVLEAGLLGHGDQRARIGVLQFDSNHLLAHVRERVHQVGDVEADLDRVARVVDLELFLRFFLLGIARRNTQGAGLDVDANAFELLARQDRRALQARQQGRAAERHMVPVVLRDHAVVVGELAFDELGDELHAGKAELGLVAGEAHFD